MKFHPCRACLSMASLSLIASFNWLSNCAHSAWIQWKKHLQTAQEKCLLKDWWDVQWDKNKSWDWTIESAKAGALSTETAKVHPIFPKIPSLNGFHSLLHLQGCCQNPKHLRNLMSLMNFEEHHFMRIIMNGMIRCLRIFFNFYLKKKDISGASRSCNLAFSVVSCATFTFSISGATLPPKSRDFWCPNHRSSTRNHQSW